MRQWFQLGLLPLLLPIIASGATLSPQGTNLTVTSANLQVSFRGLDVVGISNTATGEQYLRNPSPNTQLNLTLVQGAGQALTASGPWTVNSAGTSASLTFSDGNRTVTATIGVDSATQEIVVNLDGKAAQGGVERLIWGATGFDMAVGKFVLPAQGGISINSGSLSASNTYNFYGDAWEAPLTLFQGAQGGVAIYSTNPNSLCRDLTVSASQQQTANILFQVEAPGPWSSATEAGPIEWRLAAYAGDWQAGARIYRDSHNTALPAVPLTGPKAWANNIRTVIEYADAQPYDPTTLDKLATVVVPSETLLYLVDWRSTGFDATWPDYTWAPATPAFIAHAHQLGFYVMLHTDALGCSPVSPDYPAVQQYQLKDPLTLQPEGWLWNQPPSTPNRYAIMDPAASAWRQLWLARVTPAIQTLQPDAIHLDFTIISNDGNGLIEGMNFNQGLAQLQRDLLNAFPNLVLGAEETNDAIAPWESFSQPLYWTTSGFDPNVTPPVPISAYVLGNVRRYWHLGTTDPGTPAFTPNLAQYEGQAVLPTFRTEIPDYTQPDVARFLNVIHAFQQYGLQPAWDTNWDGAEMKYLGANGSSATVTDSGTIIQFATQQSGSPTVLYQRAHNANQIDSPLSVPNWPAWNGTVTLGLDPANQYWLDTSGKNPSLPHITSLPAGARLGVATGTLVTSPFAYFQVLPPAASAFDFFSSLWLANTGVTYNGTDYPLANGASAYLQTMTVGGVTRQAIFSSPPYSAQVGGETFVEYTVPVPSGSTPSLSFAAGIQDSAIGQRQGPMTFKVEINGAIWWIEDVSTGAWQSGTIDLRPWAGQTIKIRLVSNPGPSGNSDFGWGGWSALQLSLANSSTLGDITLAAPPSLPASAVTLTGGTASVANGTVTVQGLPAGGTVFLFTGQPTLVSAGQSLLNIPFTLSQSADGVLAGPPTGAYAGTGAISSTSSGGATKLQTLFAFPPADGQTIFSWPLQLPPSPGLAFSFSAGFWDGYAPGHNYLMSVRINGIVVWQQSIGVPASWQSGGIDLSPWSGQTVLVELISDSLGSNYNDFISWGDLVFTSTAGATCRASLGSPGPISVAASGGSGTISVTTGANCDWTASSATDWLSVTPSGGAGNGSAMYNIAANSGPARQAQLAVAGYVITVSQAGAVVSPVSVLSLTAAHTGNLSQGQNGAVYTVTVTNHVGAGPTDGMVVVTETLPTGLTLLSASGAGWTCSGNTCQRTDALAGGASYPPITVTVNVAANAPPQVTNQVSVTGGGSVPAAASDPTTIAPWPVITSVFNAAGYQAGVYSGAFVSIQGSNLAPVADDWSHSIVNGQLPQQLDGVSVTIGGKTAYISQMIPTQINAQAPDLPPGSAMVVVTTPLGASAPFTVNVQPYGPAFWPWPNNQPVATHPDYSIAAKNGTFAGVTTVPAQPGEILTLWGTGFGPTNPAVPAGQLPGASAGAQTQNPVTVNLNGAAVTVLGAALSPYPGDYQVAIQIPATLADGDYPLLATINGISSPVMTLTVKH